MSSSSPKSFTLAVILSLIGAFVSGLLVMQHYHQVHEMGLMSMMCGDESTSGCNAVNRSEYSSLLGVPVASIGLWFYLTMALLLSLASLSNSSAKDVAGWLCLLGMYAALAADVALLAVQFFALKTFCTLCLSTYAVTLLLIVILRTYRKRGSWEKLRELVRNSEGKMLLGGLSIGMILILVAVEAGSLVLAYRDPTKLEERFEEAAIAEFLQSPIQEINLADTPVQGASDAKIKVVVYSDFLCPWCRQVAQSFEQSMPLWKDRVALYYKNYPLDVFCNPFLKTTTHPGACWAVLGGLCAQEQGKFWDYHDRIFTLPPKNPGSNAVLKIAAEAGLDTTAMSTCMHEVKIQKMVRMQIIDAHNAGIDGTPRVFINGRKLPKLSYLAAVLAYEAKRLGLPPLEGLKD